MASEELRTSLGIEKADVLKNVESMLEAKLPGIFRQLGRQINISQLLVKSGLLRDLDIDKVILGQTHIDRLVLQGASALLHSANAFLKDVRISLELKITVDWFINLAVFSDSGTENLGSIFFNIPVGNIQIPSLSNIDLTIPTVTIENVSANITPIVNLDLNGGQFEKATATQTVIPSGGFQLNGLGLGNFTLSSLQVPGISTSEAKIQRFLPNNEIVLPGAQLSQLSVPSTTVNDIQSNNIAFDGVASRRGLGFDIGFLGVTVFVTPIAHMFVGSMLFQDVNLSATVNQARIENIKVPVDIRGITIKGVELVDVNVTGVNG